MGGVISCVELSLDDWANSGFADVVSTHGMVLFLWDFGIILGNGYET